MANLNDVHAKKITEAEDAIRKILFDLETVTGVEIFSLKIDSDNKVSILLDDES